MQEMTSFTKWAARGAALERKEDDMRLTYNQLVRFQSLYR